MCSTAALQKHSCSTANTHSRSKLHGSLVTPSQQLLSQEQRGDCGTVASLLTCPA